MAAVGIIVNPWAGKDVRRLHGPAGHTSDTVKIGTVRRVAIAALEAGAERILAPRDPSRIAWRALADLDRVVLFEGPGTGSAIDTRRAAEFMMTEDCRPIVVLGGDGTCRDAVVGAPDSVLITISTGTNNAFPRAIDGSSAGTAAGLIAAGVIDARTVTHPAKALHIAVDEADGSTVEDLALVDVALVDDVRVGAKAVVRPELIRIVVAAIASPASTGLSAIAGRVHRLDRTQPGAVVVRVGGSRRVRVPIVPGAFSDIAIAAIELLDDGGSIVLEGPGVLAYDGERERTLRAGSTARITVRGDGPAIVDVEAALTEAVERRLFDRPPS